MMAGSAGSPAVSLKQLVLPAAAMTLVVAAANVLVQHPVEAFDLQDKLTWGAFAYPFAFLVTDLTNRRFGPQAARRAVYVGFALAVLMSIGLATPRIALASGTAFLFGQLLDITVFTRLRRLSWWRAPLVASVLGSGIDTALFFTLAFAGLAEMSAPVALVGGLQVPLWANLGVYDLVVKLIFACALLAPYGALMSVIRPFERVEPAR